MQRLKSAFFNSLVFILAVELSVLVFGIWWLTKGGGHLPIIGLLLCFSIIPLMGNILWLVRFLRGRVLYHTTLSILMDGGKLTFDEPGSPYEVWLFCKVPLSRYHGNIAVSSINESRSWTTDVPQRSPITHSFRSDCTPIVLRSPREKKKGSGQCCLDFHLRPTLVNALVNGTFPAEDVVPMTVMVKSA